MSVLKAKLKEVLGAVLPITILVIIFHFTVTPLEPLSFKRFLLGAFSIIIGLSVFLLGVDLSITSIGQSMGKTIAKSNKIWIVVVAGLLLGFFICIAEPDLHILAGQVDYISAGKIGKNLLLVVVSAGVGLLIAFGFLRVLYNYPLHKSLAITYGIILLLALFSTPEFLAVAFDASGATTGALTVPFILALAAGISVLKKDIKSSEEDSFGLVGLASAGAIMAVLATGVLTNTGRLSGSLPAAEAVAGTVLSPFLQQLPVIAGEVSLALLPILVVFFLFQKISFKLSGRALRRIIFGLVFAFLGLLLFLTGVNAGFLDVGRVFGREIVAIGNKGYVVLMGFALGLLTVLAEPAVYVLMHQIEEVTSGYIKKSMVLIFLSIGVACAVALSMLRIMIPGIQLWHYLLPGYIIAMIMTCITPNLFVGIAFDAGGVASGPMTATFILAFANGVAAAMEGADVLTDGFGMIAMVAMAPLIALQILGFIYKIKSKKEGAESNDE